MMLKSKKAEFGIGVMILFIAMLIVTAATVAVLYEMSQKLQNTARTKSDRSREEITSKLQILNVYGINGSQGKIKNFLIEAKLNAGSSTISLNNSVIMLQLSNKSVTYSYANKPCTNVSSASGNGYYTNPVTNVGNFTISYLEAGNNYTTGRIDSDDIVRICFASPRYIVGQEQVGVRIIPSSASSNYISFQIPWVLVDARTLVYP